jgi:hypothetical protein
VKDSKVCTTCGLRKHLDEDNWRRDSSTRDGWQARCKDCAKETTANHYRKWYARDVLERGETGVKCILWSEHCGECPCPSVDDLSNCWRLADTSPEYEDYPEPLPQ